MSLSQCEYFNMLPLSDEQKLNIIKDFIEADKYDKISQDKMNHDNMITKEQPVSKEDTKIKNDIIKD